MSLEPLLAAPLSTQVHAFAAMAAFALGAVQLAAPKGTLPHRTVGWLWVALMVTVATTSFWIHDLRVWGQWSPIHLLSIFTLIMLPPAVIHAMRHRVKDHRKARWGCLPAHWWSQGSSPSGPAASCMRCCSAIERAPTSVPGGAELTARAGLRGGAAAEFQALART
jgi:uncharacterized membrane protein